MRTRTNEMDDPVESHAAAESPDALESHDLVEWNDSLDSNCPDELWLSIYCDQELPGPRALQVETHLAGCAHCALLVRSLRAENAFIHAVLVTEEPVAGSWCWPLGIAVAGVVLAPVVWAMSPVWLPTLPASLGWLAGWGTVSALISLVRFVGEAADVQVLDRVMVCALAVLLACLLLSGKVRGTASRQRWALGALVGWFAWGAVTPQAHAAEVRHAEDATVEVGSGESVEDTLFLSGRKAIINGTVHGDVFVAAETVELVGTVYGNLFSVAEDLRIAGTVEGAVLALGQDIELTGAAGSVFAGAENVFLGEDGAVLHSAYLVGESVRVRSTIDQELFFAAARVAVLGTTLRSVTGYAGRFQLGSAATVGGALHVMVPEKDAATLESGARVDGGTTVKVQPQREHDNDVLNSVLRAFAFTLALLSLGFLVERLLPFLRPRPPRTSAQVLRRMGAGFVVLVATPLLGLLIALTVIGLPVAMLLFVTYLVLVCTSSLVVALSLAELVPTLPWLPGALRLGAVLFGLLLILGIPLIGGGLSFLVVLLGVGTMALHLRELHRSGAFDVHPE